MTKRFIYLTLIGLLGFPVFTNAQNHRRLELDNNWYFRQYDTKEWLQANVPGCVHTDLLANGKIEDPYYRTNERELQWIDKVAWEYKTNFEIDDSTYVKKQKRLTFYGLDTYADIFLNGHKLGHCDNMFRTWSYDVSDMLKKGRNELNIVFLSPTGQGLKEMEKYGLALPADNDQSVLGGMENKKVSVFTRKAPYNYGWDWGPRLVTSGIWRPVVLEAWNEVRIEDTYIHPLKVDSKLAQLNAEITLTAAHPQTADIEIRHGNRIVSQQSVPLKSGKNRIGLPIKIKHPKLWWCNGLGKPHLYTFDICVKTGAQTLDNKQVTTGLRTLRLVRKKDKAGETFYFELNGVPVFAKGANYIPNDAFLPRVSRSDYEKVIADATEANMNMLRIWGGGIYEDDYFYELCDRNGIMIWQDFMFACAMYPGNPEFLENVRQEAADNLIRLRNHPCIALWCGNNEIGVAWRHNSPGGWGWKQKYSTEEQERIFQAYKDIFHRILPEAVEKYTDDMAYWPSSPMSGPGESDFELQPGTSGDNHYWGVWHGKHRLEAFADNVGRFVSEYGFQSFPEFETVKKYTVPEDYNIESDVMASHQRSGIGNLRIKEYMSWYYRVPENFEQFLYMSQVLQAKAMDIAMRTHRRAMPYCMGSLLWQLNDCWPVASWSTTDYYHNWKAAHYAVREACKPVIVVPRKNGSQLELWVVNDRLKKVKGNCIIELQDFEGNVLNRIQADFSAEGNRSVLIDHIGSDRLLKNHPREKTLAVVTLRNGNKILDEHHVYFTEPKNLDLPAHPRITTRYNEKNGRKSLTVTTDKLACDVMFYSPGNTVRFSDNYIDLLPDRTYTIELFTDITDPEIKTRFIQ
ncbi:beta-mannosidase [Culturomica massiliensis]|mgnify:FL=1|uniref:beta-mannosidase n=1 Tax=Culturomica massiliensis TaxID=1841857 RepID=UPI002666991A|nr:glycoside hydrolase family 2 protein [Culturomica massiliensis]